MSTRMFVQGHQPGLLLVFYHLWDQNQLESGMSAEKDQKLRSLLSFAEVFAELNCTQRQKLKQAVVVANFCPQALEKVKAEVGEKIRKLSFALMLERSAAFSFDWAG